MRYYVLATDYDGTLAHDGVVAERTIEALQRLRASGRHLILVTGRRLEDLFDTFAHTDEFEIVVAENGALLYFPRDKAEVILDEPPSPDFVAALQQRNVSPLAVGRVIVATWDSGKEAVLDTIEQLGLELQIIFNKGALMILPAGTNKASGLRAALQHLGLSVRNVVGIGDAENDHAFLSICECSVAVANALPALKERADLVTAGDHGDGVIELIEELLADDLARVALPHKAISLGWRADGSEVSLPAQSPSVLVAGSSGSGKSSLTTTFLEQLAEKGYQFCVFDPEGDYEAFEDALILGGPKNPPEIPAIVKALEKPEQSVIINLLGISLEERPGFFASVFPRLMELRARTGRPHWIILDEAHHVAPASSAALEGLVPQDLSSVLIVTLRPESIAGPVLATVGTIAAAGEHPQDTIAAFCRATGREEPRLESGAVEHGELLAWTRGAEPFRFRIAPSRTQRVRHSRKYAEAELTPDRSFFFRGPRNKLNLRANNLITFLQLMEGVDEETWMHHLRAHEYSEWFRQNIKDQGLAADAEAIERESGLSAAESRARFKEIIESRYTLPA